MTVSERSALSVSVQGPTGALIAQFALLAVVAGTVGLGPAGWLAGSAYAAGLGVLLGRALRRSGISALGPANQVTLARATLVGVVAALAADAVRGLTPVAVLVTLTTVALLLDGVDGQVARRTGTASPLGARFDMEVDAVLILILSGYVAVSVGAWVLAIGALRYIFVVAAWVLPWLHGPLPPRLSRKAVAAAQGIVLAIAAAGVLPAPVTVAVVALALGSLIWSFGRDVAWLWRTAPRVSAHRSSGVDGPPPGVSVHGPSGVGAPSPGPLVRLRPVTTAQPPRPGGPEPHALRSGALHPGFAYANAVPVRSISVNPLDVTASGNLSVSRPAAPAGSPRAAAEAAAPTA